MCGSIVDIQFPEAENRLEKRLKEEEERSNQYHRTKI